MFSLIFIDPGSQNVTDPTDPDPLSTELLEFVTPVKYCYLHL